MFFDIGQLQLDTMRFDEAFPPGAIELFDEQLRQITPLEAKGEAELMVALMEIRVRGHLKTRMEVACDRCLEPAEVAIDSVFDLLYRPSSCMPEREVMQVGRAEAEIGFYEGAGLELADVLREQILLTLPMQRLCREDCKGICPSCGRNRNTADCGCHEAAADSRWQALKG
jgi:uncharacterized protein